MKNIAGLVALMNGAIATPPSASTNYLRVPTNLHVFHSYYVKHYSYRYTESYSFTDKVLILDKRSSDPTRYLSSVLLNDLSKTSYRYFESGEPRYDNSHTHKFFVNWAANDNPSKHTLKNIVRMDVSNSSSPFVPFNKQIVLNYNYLHSNVIPIYALYFNGESSDNLYSRIHFGRLKSSGTGLPSSGITFQLNGPSCESVRKSYNRHYGASSEEGFDGLCDNLKIDAVNRNFRRGLVREYKWSTPYVSYKITDANNWKKQYYYYILGDLTRYSGSSHNLVEYSGKDSWFVDYDNLFALDFQDEKLVIVLNEKNERLKSLGLDRTSDNWALANFFKVSSLLNFELSFRSLNSQVKKIFTIQDVINGKAKIDSWDSANKLESDVVLTVTPRYSSSVVFPGAHPYQQEYKYKVNTEKLSNSGKIVDDVDFKLEDSSKLFASELLDPKKLAQYFFWTNGSETYPMDEKSLDLLELSGEVDDVEGTATINFKFRGEDRAIQLRGFQKIPKIQDLQIRANSTEEALKILKSKYPDASDYFWNQLSFKEKYSDTYSYEETTLQAFTKPFKASEKLFVKTDWDLSGLEIIIPNNKDFHLIQKDELASSYDDLSDLFDLNPFSSEVGLSKDDYQYQILKENEDTIEVMVSLVSGREKIPRYADRNKSYHKTYTFSKSNLQQEKPKLETDGLLESLVDSENIVVAGAGVVFLGTTGVTLMKRFGFLKTKG